VSATVTSLPRCLSDN